MVILSAGVILSFGNTLKSLQAVAAYQRKPLPALGGGGKKMQKKKRSTQQEIRNNNNNNIK